MMLTKREARIVRRICDPLWMVPRMKIRTIDGVLKDFREVMYPEQWDVLKALTTRRLVFVLKARKVGMTTLGSLFFLHRALVMPHTYNVVAVGHEEGVCKGLTRMWKTGFEGLTDGPGGAGLPFLRGETWGAMEIEVRKDAHTPSRLISLQAGGRGGGRGGTAHGAHFTEFAHYPLGSSATGKSGKNAEETADRAAVASVNSSLVQSEDSRSLYETTADGPRGVCWDLYQQASRDSDQWSFHFHPWNRMPAYEEDAPEHWMEAERNERLAECDDLDEDEKDLVLRFRLTARQLMWRRLKMRTLTMSAQRFRREYPLTELEPFEVGTTGWVDAHRVSNDIAECDPTLPTVGWRTYLPYQEGWRYYGGVDPSGGVGRDQGTIVFLREDGALAAVFSSRTTRATKLAELAAEQADYYGRARLLVEANGTYGLAALDRLRAIGANLYYNEHNDDRFVVDNPLKAAMCTITGDLYDSGLLFIRDPGLLREMATIREQRNGRIEADEGSNDDHWSALYLAVWNARSVLQGADKAVRLAEIRERETRERERLFRERISRMRNEQTLITERYR